MGKIETKTKLRITGKPIFILGIMPRSGTNFLNNLLLIHPDCEYPGIVWEDYYLAGADLLKDYSERVYNRWNPGWKEQVETMVGPNPLLKLFGDSLISYMELQYAQRKNLSADDHSFMVNEDHKKRLVSATPSVENLHLFFDLFPDARLIIIVRDGRAVVESGIKTFGWDYEEAMRRWSNNARVILDCIKMNPGENKMLVVRYEDLYIDLKKEMEKILHFLNLPVDQYDFHRAQNLGVMGSSQIRNKENKTDWVSREKTKDFNPLKRYAHWSRALHERFNWLSGSSLKELGYTAQYGNESNYLWNLQNQIIDILYALEIKSKPSLLSTSKLLRKLRYFLLDLK